MDAKKLHQQAQLQAFDAEAALIESEMDEMADSLDVVFTAECEFASAGVEHIQTVEADGNSEPSAEYAAGVLYESGWRMRDHELCCPDCWEKMENGQ